MKLYYNFILERDDEFKSDDEIIDAIKNNNIKYIETYLENNDVNKLIYDDPPGLTLSSYNATIEIYKLFIKYGLDLDVKMLSNENKTLLMMLTESSHKNVDYYYNIIDLLLDNGADINILNENNDNALLISCFYLRDSNKIQKLLIDRGSNINIQNNDKDTILNSEIYNSNTLVITTNGKTINPYISSLELVLYLLKQDNININIKDSDGNDFINNLMIFYDRLNWNILGDEYKKNIIIFTDALKDDFPYIWKLYNIKIKTNKYKI